MTIYGVTKILRKNSKHLDVDHIFFVDNQQAAKIMFNNTVSLIKGSGLYHYEHWEVTLYVAEVTESGQITSVPVGKHLAIERKGN